MKRAAGHRAAGEPRTGPRRTCVACREEADRSELVRLVRHPDTGGVVVDLKAQLPGRGAWVHPARACVEKVERQPGLLSRALDAPVTVEGLGEQLRGAVWRALLDGLSLAAAGGGLVGGHDALEAAIRAGEVELLVIADDASERTVADLTGVGTIPAARVPLTREALGTRVGTAPRAAVGVVPVSATVHLRRQLRRWLALG